MNLTERLAAAAEARAQAEQAGTTVEQFRELRMLQGLSPVPTGGLDVAQGDIARTVLITGSDLVTPVTPDPTADPKSICPTCGSTGDLGVVDLPGRTSDYSCPACSTMWRVSLEPATSR